MTNETENRVLTFVEERQQTTQLPIISMVSILLWVMNHTNHSTMEGS
jgi:hypothetical protein